MVSHKLRKARLANLKLANHSRLTKPLNKSFSFFYFNYNIVFLKVKYPFKALQIKQLRNNVDSRSIDEVAGLSDIDHVIKIKRK